MIGRRFGPAPLVLAALAFGFFGLFFYFTIHSGCAGDLKGGSLGNPMEALRLEGISFAFLGAGLLVGAMAAAFVPYQSRLERVVSAVAFFVVAGAALWIVGFFLSIEATEHCFAAQLVIQADAFGVA